MNTRWNISRIYGNITKPFYPCHEEATLLSKKKHLLPQFFLVKNLLKSLLIGLILFLSISHSQAATYYSRANAAWNVASTWSTVAYGGTAATAFPVAGDIVNIGNGYTVTVSAANAAFATLTIDAGGVLNPSSTRTITASTSITINGTYTNQSTAAITTPTWICNGTYNHATSFATLPKGTTTSTWASNSNCNITGAYTSAVQFANFIGQTFGNFTFNPSSMTNTVCLFAASGNTTILGNFTITQTGTSTLYMRQTGYQFVGVITINGNFSMAAGIFDMHNGGSTPTISSINLLGNFTLSGTSILKQTTTQSGSTVTFNFMGSSVQTVSISSTTQITSQATTPTCAIQFTVASGSTIDMGTSVLSGTNNTSFVLNAGASIITANTGGLSTSGATGSIQVSGPRTYNITSNYTYNSLVAGQITGNAVTKANNLTISNTNASGVTFSNSISISGVMAVTTGAFVNLGTFTSPVAALTLGGVTKTAGTSYGGTSSSAANILPVYFNTATGIITVSLQAPTNLSYNSPFAFSLNVAITVQNPTVTGNVTTWAITPSLPAGLSFNTSTGSISGTPTANNPSTIYTVTASNATGSTTCLVVMSVGNYRYAVASAAWNVTSTWAATSDGTPGASVPTSGDLVYIAESATNRSVTIPTGYTAVCGSLTMGNYGAATVATLTFTDATSILNVGNDLLMNRPNATATTVINVNAGTLTVGGTLKLSNSDLTPNATATLIDQVNISTGTVTTGNLLFNGQSAPQSQVIFSGAGTLNISGNITFGYILGTLTPLTGTVNFNGTTVAQTIPVGVSAVTYNNLTINNTSSGGAVINGVISGTNTTGNLSVGNISSGSTFDTGGYAIVLASGKNLTVANGSTLILSGSSGMPTVSGVGTKTFGATSVVNYNGSSQTVSSETYGHLTLSGSGTKSMPATAITIAGNFTLSGTVSVTALAAINTAGNFTLGTGTTFIASTFTHTVGGNWTNNGTFTPNSGTINFNSAGAGNIGTSNFNNITFSGAGTKTASGALIIGGNISISNNFSAGTFGHTVGGNWTNTGTFTPNSSIIIFNGSAAQSINNGSSIFYNFTIANTGANCTATSNGITVTGTFTTNSGTTLDMATNSLGVATVIHSGTLLTQNTSTTPITAGITWGGTVNYNSTSTTQTAMAGIYNNLTISTSGGATASGNITVDGVLNLASVNPVSGTKGCLEMVTNYSTYPGTTSVNPGVNTLVSYTLDMGSAGTTVGVGDVTGIVRRTTILANTSYSFGNQYTTIALTPGTMPTQMTVTIKIGSVVPGKTDAVKRLYEIVPTGGSTCFVSANFHFLDSELNGNTKSNLVVFDYDIGGSTSVPDEHGRSAYNFTNNYIGMSNIPISYFIYVPVTQEERTIFELGNHASAKYLTWTGVVSSDWSNGANWYPEGNQPDPTCYVIIPDASTTNYDPVLQATDTINTLTIQTNGVLVMGSSTLSIANSQSAGWEDQNPTGNDPGTSKVIFLNQGATISGTGRFYNLQISSGADVTNQTGSLVKIQNSITKTGSWNCNLYTNSVEYDGGSQTVVLPDGNNQYYNLTLNGSGTKTLPSSLTVSNDFALSGTASVSGTSLSVVGNFTNTSTSGSISGTVNFIGSIQQILGGTQSVTFSNMTINNANGVDIDNNETVNGILTLTNGIIITDIYSLTVGCSGSITGAGTSSYIEGKLARVFCSTGSKSFPVGKGGNYRPMTFQYTALTGTSTVTVEEFESSTISGTLPASTTLLSPTRYWSVSESGGSGETYSITLDGTGYVLSGVPVILKDGTNPLTSYSVTVAGNNYTATGLTQFGNFGIGNYLPYITWLGLSANNSWFTSSNWSSASVPASTDDIRIPSSLSYYPVISGSSPGSDVTIGSSGKLQLQAGASLTLGNGPLLTFGSGATITTGTGSMIILTSGSRYLNQSSGTPALQVQRDLTGTKGWRMVASPVATTFSDMFKSPLVTQGFTGSTYPALQPDLMWWEETDPGTTLQSWRKPSVFTDNMAGGRGYFQYLFNGAGITGGGTYTDILPQTISVTGIENYNSSSGSYNYTMTYTARTAPTTGTNYYDVNALDQGWNLIGNPTASTLDWDAASVWTKTNVDNTIYVWDPSALSGNGDYLTWNGTIGTLGNGKIPPFQAFWVHANAVSPSLSFTNGVKTATAGTFMRSPGITETVSIPITLSGQQMETTSYLTFSDNGQVGPDCMDAYRLEPMNDTWIELYTLSSPGHISPLVINNLPLADTSLVIIPLYVGSQVAGTGIGSSYLLKWHIPDNLPSGWNISLQDHQLLKSISMTDTTQYTFYYISQQVKSSTTGSMYNPKQLLKKISNISQLVNSTPPFSIVISRGGKKIDYLAPKPVLLPNYPNPFSTTGTQLRFSLPEQAQVRIDVYNLNGILIEKLLNSTCPAGFTEIKWQPSNRIPGMYFIRFISGDTAETHKVILEK